MDLLKKNHVGNQIFARKEAYLSVDGFDETMPAWQDYDLWLRILRHSNLPCRRIGASSYVTDLSHPHERISTNKAKIDKAFTLFQDKFSEYQDKDNLIGLEISKFEYGHNKFDIYKMVSYLFTSAYLRAMRLFLAKKIKNR